MFSSLKDLMLAYVRIQLCCFKNWDMNTKGRLPKLSVRKFINQRMFHQWWMILRRRPWKQQIPKAVFNNPYLCNFPPSWVGLENSWKMSKETLYSWVMKHAQDSKRRLGCGALPVCNSGSMAMVGRASQYWILEDCRLSLQGVLKFNCHKCNVASLEKITSEVQAAVCQEYLHLIYQCSHRCWYLHQWWRWCHNVGCNCPPAAGRFLCLLRDGDHAHWLWFEPIWQSLGHDSSICNVFFILLLFLFCFCFCSSPCSCSCWWLAVAVVLVLVVVSFLWPPPRKGLLEVHLRGKCQDWSDPASRSLRKLACWDGDIRVVLAALLRWNWNTRANERKGYLWYNGRSMIL